MLELAGRRALVTGAGRRVGAAIALALGRARMRVGVHHHGSAQGALETCERIRTAGGQAQALRADLLDRAEARSLVDRAVVELGGLDLLVLSAASFERTPLHRIDDRAWDQTLALNLAAPFFMAQRAAEVLRASRGSIVLVTCASRLAPERDYLAYQLSKAALHHLMRLLALELAPEVRVNAVAPGSVLPPESFGDEQMSALLERMPLGALGSAQDVADAVVHLARSEWLTATEIVIDGGRSLR
ncbi:MAG: SDR family NAD(P)-dependent oxidoreductase [Polyangiales bacterium]